MTFRDILRPATPGQPIFGWRRVPVSQKTVDFRDDWTWDVSLNSLSLAARFTLPSRPATVFPRTCVDRVKQGELGRVGAQAHDGEQPGSGRFHALTPDVPGWRAGMEGTGI